MSKQTGEFMLREGDAWLDRNRDKMSINPDGDLLLRLIDEAKLAPKRVLEIGCSNGWRLNEIHKRYGSECSGVEPSKKACREAFDKYPNIKVYGGTSHTLHFQEGYFDLVLYGFCLYLVDRKYLLRTVSEGDRVLADGGHLGILDFLTFKPPHSRIYHHQPELRTYKMDYCKLWDAGGMYSWMFGIQEGEYTADILQKDIAHSFPLWEAE